MDGPPLLDDTRIFGPNAKETFHLVVNAFLTSLTISIAGSLYVFYRAFMQWRLRGYTSIPISARFPFYISITDFCVCTITLYNMAYVAVHRTPFRDHTTCVVAGLIADFFIPWNSAMIGVISSVTYLRVCRGICFYTGRYDWKLFVASFPLPLAIVLLGVNDIGPAEFWCTSVSTGKLIPGLTFAIIAAMLVVILFCYIRIIAAVRSIERKLSSTSANSDKRRNRMEGRVSKKIASYLLVFLVKYIPVLTFNICLLAGYYQRWMMLLVTIGGGIGVIGNVTQYIINEGWDPKYLSSNGSLPSCNEDTNAESASPITITVSHDTTMLPTKMENR